MKPYYADDWVTLYHGDALAVAQDLPDHSFSAIVTDPPYIRESIYYYAWLAEIAHRLLQPNGVLLIYAGAHWKANVMAIFSGTDDLNYYWDYILLHGGSSPIMWNRRILSRYKSLLAYTKTPHNHKARFQTLSTYTATRDKRYHQWGQHMNEINYYLQAHTEPEAMILDPFTGGGTIPATAKMVRRKCVAIDQDQDAVITTAQRVIQVEAMSEIYQPYQPITATQIDLFREEVAV